MSILDRFLQRFWKCHDGVPLTVSFSASDPPKAPATSTTRGPNVTPWAEWQVKVATHYTPAGWTFYRFYLYAKRWNERAAPRVEHSNTPVDVPHLVAELEAHNRIKPIEGGRSYGAVRNFCLYQSPKKPTFKHPFPDWCRTYVALDRRKEVDEENAPPPRDPPVTHSSPTRGKIVRIGEKRREGKRREGENLNLIQNLLW